MKLSVVMPTLARPAELGRALAALEGQGPLDFEVIVVADPFGEDPAKVDAVIGTRPYPVRRIDRAAPGVSTARNDGWRAAAAPLVLFLDDDVELDPQALAGHVAWHGDHPEETVAVLGDVRWADDTPVTPFMRWLESGVHFDYLGIQGIDAGWGRFYTANVSVKRSLLERVGGFDDELPFGYEDLDLALRMHEVGLRLLYNRAASAQHHHAPTLEDWRRRVKRVAVAERKFVALHPEIEPFFFNRYSEAAARPPARGRGARLARWVGPGVPWLGPRVWGAADLYWRQQLAGPFLAAWNAP